MNRVTEIMRLMLEATPQERAEVVSLLRGKTVESRRGLLTKEDIERAVSSAKTLDDAATQLGVSRRTLQYHMRLLGLPPGRPGRRL